jgi:2-methylcitrate dehydratase PrpD
VGDRLHAGFRGLPVFDPFGAAVAAGKLLGLDEDGMTSAMGYAANFASGFREGWSQGTMEGMFHAGLSARNGIFLAALSRAGGTAAETALDGEFGFFRAFTGSAGDIEAVIGGLGNKYLITEVLTKRYPADFYHQVPLHLSLRLRERYTITAWDIEKIVLRVAPKMKLLPGNDLSGPFANQFQAQLSGQFCLAAAFLGRSVKSPALFARHYDDTEISALAEKVEMIAEENRDKFHPEIEVIMKDGKRYTADEDVLSEFIPTRKLMEEKFMSLAVDFLGESKAAEVMDMVMSLEKLNNISRLTDKLRAPSGPRE